MTEKVENKPKEKKRKVTPKKDDLIQPRSCKHNLYMCQDIAQLFQEAEDKKEIYFIYILKYFQNDSNDEINEVTDNEGKTDKSKK